MIWLAFGINKPISILSIIINFPLLILLGGLEELGWRGILQPQVEKVINYWASLKKAKRGKYEKQEQLITQKTGHNHEYCLILDVLSS
jgi:hypothetical protein